MAASRLLIKMLMQHVLFIQRNKRKTGGKFTDLNDLLFQKHLNDDFQFYNNSWNDSFILNLFYLFHFPSWLNGDTSICHQILAKICHHFLFLKTNDKLKMKIKMQ